jgi:hypothetical protein
MRGSLLRIDQGLRSSGIRIVVGEFGEQGIGLLVADRDEPGRWPGAVCHSVSRRNLLRGSSWPGWSSDRAGSQVCQRQPGWLASHSRGNLRACPRRPARSGARSPPSTRCDGGCVSVAEGSRVPAGSAGRRVDRLKVDREVHLVLAVMDRPLQPNETDVVTLRSGSRARRPCRCRAVRGEQFPGHLLNNCWALTASDGSSLVPSAEVGR